MHEQLHASDLARNLDENASLRGKVVKDFSADKANMVAGMIIGTLMVVGGTALFGFVANEVYAHWGHMPLFAEKRMSWATSALCVLISGTLLVVGAIMIGWAYKHLSHRVAVYAEGLTYCFKKRSDWIAWGEIKEFREQIVWERPPLLKGPARLLIPKTANYSYEIVRIDGSTFPFYANSISDLASLVVMFRAIANERGIPWTVTEIK